MRSIKKSLMLTVGISFGFFSSGAFADCAPTELSWGLISSDGKTKYCQTTTFPIKEGQKAIYFNSGRQIDGKRYVGSIEAKCSSGRVVQMSSSCKEGSGSAGSGPLENSRITGENFSPIAVSNGSTSKSIANRTDSRKIQARSVNNLESSGAPFDLGDFAAISRIETVIGGAKAIGAVVGNGNSGVVISGFMPIDVKAVILEITAQFHATDGSQFKYVDTVFCAPSCQDPIRSSMSVAKGGGSGHYWGYEQTVKTLKQVNIVAPANTPFALTIGQNHLLKDVNARVNFIPADSPVLGNPADFFPKTTAGLPLCAGSLSITDNSNGNSATTSYSKITPIVRDVSGCVASTISNSATYNCSTSRFTGYRCFGDATGNSALTIQQYTCPAGLNKHIDGSIISCRSN